KVAWFFASTDFDASVGQLPRPRQHIQAILANSHRVLLHGPMLAAALVAESHWLNRSLSVMIVEQRDITTIRPYANNPRLNDAAAAAVAASIPTFGFRQPIVVDEDGVIIVGHTRYKAALKLEMTSVPVHVATGLSPAQVRAYRIADNQTATLSAWDDDKL